MQLCAVARPLACQRGKLIAAQGDLFVQGIQLPMGFGQRCLRLADFEMRADAALEASFGKLEDLLLLLERGLDDIALGIVQRQLDIHPHDIVLQFEFGQARLGHAYVGQVHGTLAGIVLPAPQVQGITEAHRRVVVPGIAAGQFAGAVELVGRPIVALERGLAINLQ
ncbi:hypothetical protein D9M71_370300 [compost metagenome]